MLFNTPNVHRSWRKMKAHQMLFKLIHYVSCQSEGRRPLLERRSFSVQFSLAWMGQAVTYVVDCRHGAVRWTNSHMDSTLKSHFFCVIVRIRKIHFFKVSEEKNPGNATERESVKQGQSKRKEKHRTSQASGRPLCLQSK